MLEAVTPTELAARLGFGGYDGKPWLAPIADAARLCVTAWGRPSRQRVAAYLHRQLAAMAFDEEAARDQVRAVLDGLLEIGDLAQVRVDGRNCIVSARPLVVSISESEHVLLGAHRDPSSSPASGRNSIVRHVIGAAGELFQGAERLDLNAWIGPSAYLRHLHRRNGTQETVPLRDFWAHLAEAVGRDGAPIDAGRVRVLSHPPAWRGGYFGRHDGPTAEGRWSTETTNGIWCAVRPGYTEYQWHPILISQSGTEARALDLHDWDEWNWALLARGVASKDAERMRFEEQRLVFEHPIPAQFRRALLLLGEPAERAWTWKLSAAAAARFSQWHQAVMST